MPTPPAADKDGGEGGAADKENGDDEDGPGGDGGKGNINSNAGGGGGYHRTVLLLDAHAVANDEKTCASTFLILDRPQIRRAYRVYVINN